MTGMRLLVLLMGLTLMSSAPLGFPLQQGEEVISNDAVIQLLKFGVDEDTIIAKIQKSKYNFDLSVKGMVALKQGGVSDRLMHFLIDPSKPPEAKAAAASVRASEPLVVSTESREPAKTPVLVAATAPLPSLPTEIGVYVMKDQKWIEIQPEVVTWKTGGALKHIGSMGIVKGDVNGRINSGHSRNYVRTPLEFTIVVAEGIAITEYQLIHLHEQSEAREFRTVTGGVLHTSGGATRDLLQFEGNKVASRTFSVKLPTLGAGEYGFLPPGAAMSSSSASLGKMYTFRVGE